MLMLTATVQSSSVFSTSVLLSTSANRCSSRVLQLFSWETTSNVAAVNGAQNANRRIERRGRERAWARDKDQAVCRFPHSFSHPPRLGVRLRTSILGTCVRCVGHLKSVWAKRDLWVCAEDLKRFVFKAHNLSQPPQLGKGSDDYVWQWCELRGAS